MKKNNWLMPIVVAGLAIHTFNNKLFNVSKEKLRKRELTQKVYNWKFGTISYKKYGAGDPILLIHDTFSGSSSVEFDRLTHQLSKKYEVFCLDLLGYGFSERATITYTAYLYVQLVNDFINEIIAKDNVSVITSGNSHIFALMCSQQENYLIKKLIMINPGDLRLISMNPTKRDHALKYLLELPFIGTTLYNLIHCRSNFNNLFSKSKNSNMMSFYVDQFYHNAHFENSNARYPFASYVTNYLNLDIREILKESNMSLYIISGESRDFDYRIVHKQYTDYNPSIECEVIKKASDFPHLENPFATYDILQLFLQD
jgi:pimeloyl-ACP methyl ester carboxylesterase